jgi:hypothetical protein
MSVNLIETTTYAKTVEQNNPGAKSGFPTCRRMLDMLRFTKGCVEAQPPEKKAAQCLAVNDCNQSPTDYPPNPTQKQRR